jgi:hypothetical protein
MKQAILHLGLHKTGTTSIQNSFRGYDDGEIAYANLGSPNHSTVFKALFLQNAVYPWKNQGLSEKKIENLINRHWLALTKQLDRKHSRIIFSGEGISKLDIESLYRIKNTFNEHQRDAIVFVAVREPLGMTASLMQEMVKGGKDLQNESTDKDVVSYSLSKRINNILTVFGDENTHILRLEDAFSSEFPRGIVDYFAKQLNIKPERIPTIKSQNQSIGETTYKLLNSFFQSGVVHNRGQMLSSVRWKFIDMLNEIVSNDARDKIDPSAFRPKVDWDDYRELNSFLACPYEIHDNNDCATEPFSKYCNDINHKEVCRSLTNYFKGRAIPVPSDCNSHELVTLLFYQAIQDHAAQPHPRTLNKIKQKLTKRALSLSPLGKLRSLTNLVLG